MSRHAMRLAFGAVFGAVIAGCQSDSPGDTGPVVRDSAGVRIVENGDGPVPVWRLSSTPLVDIGSDTDPLTSLFQVEGAHRLSDGRIVVANRSTDELRFYSATGEFIDAVGRKGEGPGEYDYIAWTTRCGTDSLYVYDISNRRLTVLDDRGEMLRIGHLMLPKNTLPYGRSSCQRGGPFVTAGWPKADTEPGLHRPTMPVGLAGLDGEPIAVLGEFPGVDRWGQVFEGRLVGSRPLPFGRSLHHAILEDRVFVGTNDTYEVSGFRLDGTLALLIRLTVPDRPFTATDVEAYIESELGGITDEKERRWTRSQYREMELPERLPPYSAFVATDTGLWIQDYPAPQDQEVLWRRFTADGVYAGRLAMPSDLRVLEIGTDYVLGVTRDEMDVEHVRLFGLMDPMGEPAGREMR